MLLQNSSDRQIKIKFKKHLTFKHLKILIIGNNLEKVHFKENRFNLHGQINQFNSCMNEYIIYLFNEDKIHVLLIEI